MLQVEADGDAHMAAGEYEQAAVCFGLCLEQKECDPRVLGNEEWARIFACGPRA